MLSWFDCVSKINDFRWHSVDTVDKICSIQHWKYSHQMSPNLFFICHYFTRSLFPLQLAIDCSLILPFILFTSFEETVSASRRKNANACLARLFLQGQSGRGVNEWQSVLITRRGYLGLVCLISPNVFQLLMLPNCRLHKAGLFIIARVSCILWA